jgi:hypothetical protein
MIDLQLQMVQICEPLDFAIGSVNAIGQTRVVLFDLSEFQIVKRRNYKLLIHLAGHIGILATKFGI